jgi:hypothetical protein
MLNAAALSIVCNIYMNTATKAQHEENKLKWIRSKCVIYEIKLFIFGQVSCSMSAMWCFYGYQDYPASIPAVCSFKVQTQQQLAFMNKSGKVSDLHVYYNRPHKLDAFMYVDYLKTYNHSAKLPIYYQNNIDICINNIQSDQHYFQVVINDIHVYIYIPLKKVK